jgi:thiamine biosynthesis lipoprotein
VSAPDIAAGGYGRILRRMIVPALFVGALFIVLWWRSPDAGAARPTTTFSGAALGTTYNVRVVHDAPLSDAARRGLQERVEAALAAVDRSMSTWREDSELSRLNRHGTEPFVASSELFEVLAAALEIGERSRGALDITVGPLVDAWGFGPGEVLDLPSEEKLGELMERTGSALLVLDPEERTVSKKVPGVEIDLSAIAKGYAVDRVAEVLENAGSLGFMAEVGGEVVARGQNADGRSWRIGIEVPDPERRAVHTVVRLEDAALATSGDYRNFRVEDGEILSHIIDPRTGRPVGHALASVSVISDTCMAADGWATALSVLGPREGLEVARQEELAVLFISRTSDGGPLEEEATEIFERYRALESNESGDQ